MLLHTPCALHTRCVAAQSRPMMTPLSKYLDMQRTPSWRVARNGKRLRVIPLCCAVLAALRACRTSFHAHTHTQLLTHTHLLPHTHLLSEHNRLAHTMRLSPAVCLSRCPRGPSSSKTASRWGRVTRRSRGSRAAATLADLPQVVTQVPHPVEARSSGAALHPPPTPPRVPPQRGERRLRRRHGERHPLARTPPSVPRRLGVLRQGRDLRVGPRQVAAGTQDRVHPKAAARPAMARLLVDRRTVPLLVPLLVPVVHPSRRSQLSQASLRRLAGEHRRPTGRRSSRSRLSSSRRRRSSSNRHRRSSSMAVHRLLMPLRHPPTRTALPAAVPLQTPTALLLLGTRPPPLRRRRMARRRAEQSREWLSQRRVRRSLSRLERLGRSAPGGYTPLARVPTQGLC